MVKEIAFDIVMKAKEGTYSPSKMVADSLIRAHAGQGKPFTDHHQPMPLKSPVAGRGSILPGEPVAILITLEYILGNIMSVIPCQLLKTFSDSHSAVVIHQL